MPVEQLQLPKLRSRRPSVPGPDEIAVMLYWLNQTADWTTADQLLRLMGRPANETERRRIRALAEAANGQIASGPGTPGYKLTSKCTPEDMNLIAGLRSQARDMLKRYLRIRRAWHEAQPRPLLP